MKSIIKQLLKLTAYLSITVCATITAPELHNHFLRHQVGENVVKVVALQSEKSGGTGFAIKGDSGVDYIMTNNHVCQMQKNGVIRIKINEGEPVFKRVVHIDSIHDLCLIEGDSSLTPIRVSSALSKGDFVYVIGHPGLRSLTVSSGEYIGPKVIEMLENASTRKSCSGRVQELSPFEQLMYQAEFICIKSFDTSEITAVSYGGNSGSPVVNKYGNLVGVLFAGSSQQEHNNFVVPLSYIQKLLARY